MENIIVDGIRLLKINLSFDSRDTNILQTTVQTSIKGIVPRNKITFCPTFRCNWNLFRYSYSATAP